MTDRGLRRRVRQSQRGLADVSVKDQMSVYSTRTEWNWTLFRERQFIFVQFICCEQALGFHKLVIVRKYYRGLLRKKSKHYFGNLV